LALLDLEIKTRNFDLIKKIMKKLMHNVRAKIGHVTFRLNLLLH